MRQSHTLTVVATADAKDSADFVSPTGSSRPPRPPLAGSKSTTGSKATAPTTAPPTGTSTTQTATGSNGTGSGNRHPAPTVPRAPMAPGSAPDSNFATDDWDDLESSSELDAHGGTVRVAAGKRTTATTGAQAKNERNFSAPVTAAAGVRQDENWLNEDFDD